MDLIGPSRTEMERETKLLLDTLMTVYTPKQRLRSKDKLVAKKILSLLQNFDGKTGQCYFCKAVGSVESDLQIHHLNYQISDNRIENLALAHQGCNTRDFNRLRVGQSSSSDPGGRESAIMPGAHRHTYELTAPESEKSWTNREGAKHDLMRFRWNPWIRDLENGPFAKSKELYVSKLAKKAPWALGQEGSSLGSSVTYRRFIEEDIEGGILVADIDSFGKRFVKLGNIQPKTESQ